MKIALICEKCGYISSEGDESTAVIDFKQKQISYMCQNPKCRHDNIFDIGGWGEQSKKSPLPRIRIT